MNLIQERLQKLGKELRLCIGAQYPFINSGGCAIYARILGDILEEYGFEVTYSIRANLNNNKISDFKRYMGSTALLNSKRMFVNHVLVVANKNHYLDSEGHKSWSMITSMVHEDVIHNIPKDIVDYWLTEKTWNSGYAPTMREKVTLIETTRMIVKDILKKY